MSLLFLCLFIFLIAYFFFVADIFINRRTDFLILFPSKDKINHPKLEQKIIQKDNHNIDIWINKLNKSDTANFYVLHLNGNASRAEDDAVILEDIWQNYNAEIWCMNYPGYGSSSGQAKLNLFAKFAARTFEELKRVAQSKPIIISGNSIGTTVALFLAAKYSDSINGLFLKNPPPLRELIIGQHGWWNLWFGALPIAFSIPQELDSLANSKLSKAPAVFVSAEKDEIVPVQYQNQIVQKYKGERRIVQMHGADHNYFPSCLENRDLESAIDWLTKLVNKVS